MSLHKEIHFEVEIAEYLGQHGWVYEEGVSAQYERARALFPEDVIAWVVDASPICCSDACCHLDDKIAG